MRKMRGFSALLLCVAMLCVLLSGCGNVRLTTNISQRDLLKSDNMTMSIGEAKLYLMTLTNEYKTLYDFNIWEKLEAAGNEAGIEELKLYMKDRTMERVQNVFCMYLLAMDNELTLSDNETALVTKAAEEFYNGLTDEEKDYLGVKKEDVVTAYTRWTLANKIYEQMTGDQVNQISDETARVMTGNMIYLKDENTANEIKEKLADGADFASLAAMYTTLSTVEQDIYRGAFPDEVVDAAFALEEGENSGMIRASGFYFVSCTNRLDVERTEENRAVIERRYREENFDANFDEYLKTIYLQMSEETWDEVEVRTDEAIGATNFFTVYNSYF